MLFGKKKSASMPLKKIRALSGRGLKYVSERDSESYKEIRLGDGGAVNIIGDEFVLICENGWTMRTALEKTEVSELMSLGGIVVRGCDNISGRNLTVTAYFSDGKVKL